MKTPRIIVVVLVAVSIAGCASGIARNDLSMRERALAPTLVPVAKNAPATSSADSSLATAADPSGNDLLSEALVAFPELEPEIRRYGTPDAIDARATGVTLYYKQPARTLVYEKPAGISHLHETMDLRVVPRSVQRLGFQEAVMPPPWPVTLTEPQANILGVVRPGAPADPDDPASYAAKYHKRSEEVQEEFPVIRKGDAYDRAHKAFARMNPQAQLPGFDWRLVVVRSDCHVAIFVPDGSLFISDSLMSVLDDAELVAVVAHLMGHEAYGHDRDYWLEASALKKTGVVVLATAIVLAAGAAGYGFGPPSPPPYIGYSEAQEIVANYMAAQYLAAVEIPPDTLFDTMAKLGRPECIGSLTARRLDQTTDFSVFHHTQRNAADLGLMLDAGVIR